MAPLDHEDLVRAVAMALAQVELARSESFPGGSLHAGGITNGEHPHPTVYTERIGRTSQVSMGNSPDNIIDGSATGERVDEHDADGPPTPGRGDSEP